MNTFLERVDHQHVRVIYGNWYDMIGPINTGHKAFLQATECAEFVCIRATSEPRQTHPTRKARREKK